jgi:hypothetical protein
MIPPYKVNGMEVDDMLAAHVEEPHPPKGLGLGDEKYLLPTDGDDGGM